MHDKPRWFNVVVLVAVLAMAAISVTVAWVLLSTADNADAPSYEQSAPPDAPDATGPVDGPPAAPPAHEDGAPDAPNPPATDEAPPPAVEPDVPQIPRIEGDRGLEAADDGAALPAVEPPDAGLDPLADPDGAGLPSAADRDEGLPRVETGSGGLEPIGN